jgi:ParB/RepB/Spo0J family partition protein
METVLRLDLHGLIPRFAPLRLRDPARLRRLHRSIAQQGQLTPVVAVPEAGDPPQWVLIDGYRRREVLQQLGADRIWADIWERSVDEALLACLARGPDRAWEAIEEAALIAELAGRYSLHTIAQQLGRDVSWVSRRLSLPKALPEAVLAQVRQGRLTVWAATRIVAPLARANSAHARALLAQLAQDPLSTGELKRLYDHYRQAPQGQRERLLANPRLFLQALATREQQGAEARLAAGPEGAWCKDLAVVGEILERLVHQVPMLFAPTQDPRTCARLREAFASAKTGFDRLAQALAQVPEP